MPYGGDFLTGPDESPAWRPRLAYGHGTHLQCQLEHSADELGDLRRLAGSVPATLSAHPVARRPRPELVGNQTHMPDHGVKPHQFGELVSRSVASASTKMREASR